MPSLAPSDTLPGARPLRLAHRGDHRRAPENTIAALVAALAIPGCDGVEVDVRASADGTPVLLHDADLGRVFGRPGLAAERSATELAAVGVPALAAALAALPLDAFVDVELKEAVVEATVAVAAAARGDPPSWLVLSSFDPVVLDEAGWQAPAWPRWLNRTDLTPATIGLALELGCAGVSIEWHALDPRSIRRAREVGLAVAAWTVRRQATAARLARLGLHALCVEGPALDPRP